MNETFKAYLKPKTNMQYITVHQSLDEVAAYIIMFQAFFPSNFTWHSCNDTLPMLVNMSPFVHFH